MMAPTTLSIVIKAQVQTYAVFSCLLHSNANVINISIMTETMLC